MWLKMVKLLSSMNLRSRLMFGRRYSDGLHQAIEAKEGLRKLNAKSQTLASVTFQNYFRMYDKLSGMTGTAKTEERIYRYLWIRGYTNSTK